LYFRKIGRRIYAEPLSRKRQESFLSSIYRLEGSTLSDQAFLMLEREIVSGVIPMGAKLGEEVLAARLGVSRGPLREALRRLEGRSLVERTAHAGVRVVMLEMRDVVELYQLREYLEGLAVRLACENMDDEALNGLETLVSQQSDRDDISYSTGIGDADFHFRIAAASGSARLQKLLCLDLYSLARLCRFKTWSIPGQHRSYRDHQRIVEALRERDADLSEMLMRRHIASARERFMQAQRGGGR
jgi:DNA-binding GntR family transcriptional regulator